ncbi:MAG: hypothetical protein ACI88A_003179 [Paraglaciecola sp.]
MSGFSVHGTVVLDIEERILFVEGAGPWNMESILESGKQVLPLLELLAGAPWGALVILHGEPIYVPDAAEYLSASIKKEKKQGRVATAVIVDESNDPGFAKRHLTQIYDKAGEVFRFFVDREEAKWWLIQRITLALNEKH